MSDTKFAPAETLEQQVKAVIKAHETSYVQRPDTGWHWSCSCGDFFGFSSRDACVDMTQNHWAQMIAPVARQVREEAVRELRQATDALVESDGHETTCHFTGCTCGRVESYKIARANYLRLRARFGVKEGS